MPPQPRHRLASLRLHLGPQRLLFRVRGTREQEVLPGEHAGLVAEVVEVLALVEAAAPDPDEVDPGGCRLRDALRVALAVHAVRERVVGDPVHAAHVGGAAVHHETEGGAVGIGGDIHLHRAEADAQVAAVERGGRGIHQLDGEVVPVRLTVAARPPALDFGDADDRADRGCAVRNRNLDRPSGERHAQVERGVGGAVEVDRHLHNAVRAVDGRHDAERGEASRRPRLEPHRPPDARRRGVDAPVPAEARRHLADRVVRVVVHVRSRAQLAGGAVGGGHGCAEGDLELVAALAQHPLDRHSVAAVLVRRLEHGRAVQPHGGNGVQAVECEVDPVGALEIPVEPELVDEVGRADPRLQALIVVEVRVVDQSGGEQVSVHGARDGCRDGSGLPHGRGRPALGGANRPPIVQGPALDHLTAPDVNPL
jgi:hypothetical protein